LLKISKVKQRKRCSSMISKPLSEEYKTRTMGVISGDTVSIMRGNFKGVEGKVTKVNYKKNFINIEGVTVEKANGDTIFVPIPPSKVMISKFNLDDKRRKDILDRRTSIKIPQVKLGTKRKKSRRKSKSE
jgi:large subunit ribosomal protein L24